MNLSLKCLFCESTRIRASLYPPTNFNDRTFNYVLCEKCKLIFLNPLPSQNDLEAMYPVSYQGEPDCTIHKPEKTLSGLRFPYQLHFLLIEKFVKGGKFLDFGCGDGNFIFNARIQKNYLFEGVEFNPNIVKMLQGKNKENAFFTNDFFFSSGKKYDLIRLSNVFEHLTEPGDFLKKIKLHLEPEGLILIEGPLEANFTLAQTLRNQYMRVKKILKITSSHPPNHIIFTNKKNQEMIFFKNGFETLYYKLTEKSWPYPESISKVKSLKNLFAFILGSLSIFFSRLNRNWGNTFIYVGKNKTN